MRRTTFWTVVLLLAAGLACGGMGGGGGGGGGSGAITSQQMRDLQAQYDNMYNLIQRVRPSWLQTRGEVSFQDTDADLPVVFVDGVERGQPSVLRRIDPSNVGEAEYMSSRDATTRYGTGYSGGVIQISTRSGG